MCNRYRMTARNFDVARALNIALPFDDYPNLPPPELFPRKHAWVAREVDGRRILDVMSWGFPHLVKTPKTGKVIEKPVCNVRNLSSPFWRMAIASPARRCVERLCRASFVHERCPALLLLGREGACDLKVNPA